MTNPATQLVGTAPTDGHAAPTTAASLCTPENANESVRALTHGMVCGERDAYVRLFALRCAFVEREASRRFRRRLARYRDLAEDAVQETWLRVARAPRRCESESKLDAWLQRVVATSVVDLLRGELSRQIREETVARTRHEVQEFVFDVELLESTRRELHQLSILSGEERSILELRARTSATLAQLGCMVGLGKAAVDSRLRRAAARARQAMEGVTP